MTGETSRPSGYDIAAGKAERRARNSKYGFGAIGIVIDMLDEPAVMDKIDFATHLPDLKGESREYIRAALGQAAAELKERAERDEGVAKVDHNLAAEERERFDSPHSS